MQKNFSKNIFTKYESGLQRVQTHSAFTLVELIVVITIVGILSTIGFVAYSGYLGGARDGNRIASMTKLSDSLQTYAAAKSLPLPDDAINIEASGAIIAYQGYVGENVLETIDYTNGGKDPKDDSYYTYYLTKDRKKLQLLTFLEEQTVGLNSTLALTPTLSQREREQSAILPLLGGEGIQGGGIQRVVGVKNAFASDYSNRYPKTYGQKLGVLISSESATKNTPAQEISANISAGKLDVVTTSANYTAIIDDNEIVTGTGTDLIVSAAKEIAGKNSKSCKEILEKFPYFQGVDGEYVISANNQEVRVYCDMTIEGGGWTKIGDNLNYGGNFQNQYQILFPLKDISQFLATQRSGFISCANNRVNETSCNWNRCSSVKSFEIKYNNSYLFEQANFFTVAPGCSRNGENDPFICSLSNVINLKDFDFITPTWYEPSHNISVSDNTGSLFIDLYVR